MLIYNLGCGTKTAPIAVNIDWSIHLRLRKWRLSRLAGSRAPLIRQLPASILVHDLRRGIPASDGTVDVVYHSHLLEHIDRAAADAFMTEVFRVLRPGGVQRIVVPDLERLTRRYLENFGRPGHDERVADILEQLVRREAAGTASQRRLRRHVENFLLGDAQKRGEAHRWMYDQVTLVELLGRNGFVDPKVLDYAHSSIAGWAEIGLDTNDDGSPHKASSLYVEARKRPN